MRFEKQATGENDNTWGTLLSTLLDILDTAVAGSSSVAVTSANQALTTASGSADQARSAMIVLTGTPGAAFAIYIPPSSKSYIFRNDVATYTATIYCSTVIGNTTAAGAGIAIPTGKTAIVRSDGTVVYDAIDNIAGNLRIGGTLTVTGNSTFTGTANGSTLAKATRQEFLSGTAATYTTPAGVRRIVVRQKAGGGGGCGSNQSNPGAGSVGGTTSFNSITVIGGAGAANAGYGQGALGGTGGTGTAFRQAGASGNNGCVRIVSGTNADSVGGSGGGVGGSNGGVNGASGNHAVANTGGGGGGGGSASVAFATIGGYIIGGGGGEGEYAEITVDAPAATYTYTVGAGGAGGTPASGSPGGNGAAGYIIVDEYY